MRIIIDETHHDMAMQLWMTCDLLVQELPGSARSVDQHWFPLGRDMPGSLAQEKRIQEAKAET
jgi:hypothetical protein